MEDLNKTNQTQKEIMVSSGFTKFLRKCVLFQLIRFIAINFKMLSMVKKSH